MKKLSIIFKSRIYTAIMLLVFIFTTGVLGFKSLNGYSWVDAVYMTVITITTVGFSEVHPLSDFGKIFTLSLILSSVVIFAYAIKVITEYILRKSNIEEYHRRKMEKKIAKLNDHIIICGFGRNGRQAAQKLIDYNKDFVIIENDDEVINSYTDSDYLFVKGDASEDSVLFSAGIDRASVLITALPDDALNLFVVLTSKQINSSLKIISRATNESSLNKLRFAGADNVVLPNVIGGDHMASIVVAPGLVEFIDNISLVGEGKTNIEEVEVERLYDTTEVKTISDLDLRKNSGCSVIGFKNINGEYEVNPEAGTHLVKGSTIIVLGTHKQILKLNSYFNLK